ncbi:hypothetical protein ACFQX7_30830 [Luedemannella flava]
MHDRAAPPSTRSTGQVTLRTRSRASVPAYPKPATTRSTSSRAVRSTSGVSGDAARTTRAPDHGNAQAHAVAATGRSSPAPDPAVSSAATDAACSAIVAVPVRWW